MTKLYAQTSGTQTTNASSPVPMPGLSIQVPEGVDDAALIILNVPNPYAEGNNYPGGWFGISVDGKILAPYASFTYGEPQPASFNRMPTTLVALVPLTTSVQTVQAVWQGIRGSTVIIDSPASLSGILT